MSRSRVRGKLVFLLLLAAAIVFVVRKATADSGGTYDPGLDS